jgi:GDP-L-fucose synthase
MAMTKAKEKIFVANHQGLLGAAVVRQITAQTHEHANVITAPPLQPIDLTDQVATRDYLLSEHPTQVCAALGDFAGAHLLRSDASEQLYTGLISATNLVEASFRAGVKRLLLIGSSSAYPAEAMAPIAEEDLLTGPFSPSNQAPALATIAAIKLCESYNRSFGERQGISYRCLISATPFGPGSATPHAESVIHNLMRLISKAKEEEAPSVTLPLQANGRQEFLFADDVARAALFVMNMDNRQYANKTHPAHGFLNAGSGVDTSYKSLVYSLATLIGYPGTLRFQPARPEHRSRRLDSHRLQSLGWRPQLDLEDALALTYLDFLSRERCLTH